MNDTPTDFHAYPDASGHFGRHGGRFVAETLAGPLQELAAAYDAARADPAFVAALEADLADYVGRPSPSTRRRPHPPCRRRPHPAQARDLNHTGAHKINNTIGQPVLASRMARPPYAETARPARVQRHRGRAPGPGCVVYMGRPTSLARLSTSSHEAARRHGCR